MKKYVDKNNHELFPLVVITGASSGIGEALAYRLAVRKSIRLLLAGRNHERTEATCTRCRNLGAPEVISCVGDLYETAYISNLVSTCASIGKILALVNNAGIGLFAPIEQTTEAYWEKVIGLNLKALFTLCRDFSTVMMEQEGGSTIINVSSDADSRGFSHASAYCASKGGVLALSKALQVEMRPYGIRICTLSPGRVDTHFNNKAPGMRPGALHADEVAEVIEFIITCSPNIELTEIRLDSMSRKES